MSTRETRGQGTHMCSGCRKGAQAEPSLDGKYAQSGYERDCEYAYGWDKVSDSDS